ncbi:TPA: hypothetical protein ACH3X1_014477 [Trebouxia sp. C0004]
MALHDSDSDAPSQGHGLSQSDKRHVQKGKLAIQLHHHLQTMAPAAGVQIRHLRLTDLVYADDICLLAGSPQHLQALIDALVGYCATLHMEISVAKSDLMVVSRSLHH